MKKLAGMLGLKKLSAYLNFTTSIRINNRKFRVPIINNVGFMNLSVHEDFFLQIFKGVDLPGNACFIDIGANVGQTLLKFRSCSDAAYYGFEPNPGCVYYLNSLISVNKMKDATIIPTGLAAGDHIAKFYKKGSVDSAGTIVEGLRPEFYSQGDVEYVPVFRFDGLDLINDKRISLVKIDVEGAEYEVLSGMTETIKKHKPAILCEVLDSHNEENVPHVQARADKLVALMHSLDYKIYRIVHNDAGIFPEEISEIRLRKWVPESWNLNDYLFLPSGVQYSDVIRG